MAAIIQPTTILTISPPSSSSFSCFPFRFPSPSSLSNTPPSLSKLKRQTPLYSCVYTSPPFQFLSSSPSSVSNSQPLSTQFIDTFFDLLRFSTRYDDVNLSRAVHACILKFDEDTHLGNALISAYLRLGFLPEAYKVFSSLSCPNVVSYTALISAFSKSNREDEAVELFSKMWGSGIWPNEYSFVAILTACIRTVNYELGSQIHAAIIKMGYSDYIFVANALMCLYSKCGYLNLALKLFDEIPHRDLASWNTVISSLVKEFMYEESFGIFRNMWKSDGFKVDYLTLSTLLTACTGRIASMKGREIHGHAIKVGLEADLSVGNSLIRFYSKCGSINDVLKLFDKMTVRDVITWTELVTLYMESGLLDSAVEAFNKMPERNCISYNSVLAGLSKNGEGLQALRFFSLMLWKRVELSEFTLTSIAHACGLLQDYHVCKQVHGFIVKFGIVQSNTCIETALVHMYMKCGKMSDAEGMFDQLPTDKDRTTMLTSLISGYARNGFLDRAVSLFHFNQSEGTIIIDEVASSTILGICGELGFLEMGKQMHGLAVKSSLISDVGVANSTLGMYSKCSNMFDSVNIFNQMSNRDIVSWNGLISGHLIHRNGDEILSIWENMEKMGIKPSKLTLLLIISAYKHTKSSLVDKCHCLFFSMKAVYNIEPSSEHYASFVSVLGRWGLLDEAEETIQKMPFKPDIVVWRALLDSCRIKSNEIIGKRAVKNILDMEPKDPSSYILVSNLHSSLGRWHRSEAVREEMRERGFRKYPGQSWIIYENKIHSFYVRDKSHSQYKDICSGLEILILECLKAGYEPDLSYVLHEVEEHQKKDFLFYHSVKLAATYGILMGRPGMPVRIVKNILLCGDCHNFLKYVSVVTRRDIVVRDTSGFHCFSNGHCSCKDHW